MALNRNEGGKAGQFDIGQDFRNFLNQATSNPTDPNAPNETPSQSTAPPPNEVPTLNMAPPQPPILTPPSPEAHLSNSPPQESNAQSPRERQGPSAGPAIGGNPDAPSPAASMPTPPRPDSPTPVAGGQPQPVTPLPAPSPMDMVRPNDPQQFDMLGKGSMLGGAGGLLGGGLGSPGQFDGVDSQSNILPMLLQLLASQKGQ